MDQRYVIDATVEHELEDYYQKLARFNLRSASQSTSRVTLQLTSQMLSLLKEPTLLLDRLDNDD
jgi:hypothetical protein